jgi:3-carboxy-cis,cis-muconate cycloisomerase
MTAAGSEVPALTNNQMTDRQNRTDGVAAYFSSVARLQAMLHVEAALADAEASVGVIPRAAAEAIRRAARAELYDAIAIESEARQAGNLAIPLVRHLTARVGSADVASARYVHWGATSQDIIDTALVLQLRESVPVIIGDLARAADAAAGHARRHTQTPMAGRTWLQQATPITFGLKAAGWLDALDRVTRSLRSALDAALVLQLGGASGTLAALGDQGSAVATAMGQGLTLTVAAIPWHAHRDRLAALACALGVATGTAGKIARDLGLLAQTEVAEAHEPAGAAGGSSSMPHKQNPVRAAIAIAAAVRAPGLVATMLSAMPQEHERGLGGWRAEWDTLPELVTIAGDAAGAVAGALETLVVDPARMRTNLDITGGLVLAEAVALRLAPGMGKPDAHAHVERAARLAAGEHRRFADVLAEDPAVAAILDRSSIEQALAPDDYLGSAATFVAHVLARHEKA